MKRREVIKNLGLGAGLLVMGPSALSLLHSCGKEPQAKWQPVFLTTSNGMVLEKLLDIILPSTDTPGAGDLNLAQFIDAYMEEVATVEQQNLFKKGAGDFSEVFQEIHQKKAEEGTEEEYEKILAQLLVSTPERSEKNLKRTTETQDPLDKDPDEKTDFNEGAAAFLETVRELGIWGWRNSRAIGEEVLWYDPNPGQYIACGPLSELGNGRAMSL